MTVGDFNLPVLKTGTPRRQKVSNYMEDLNQKNILIDLPICKDIVHIEYS